MDTIAVLSLVLPRRLIAAEIFYIIIFIIIKKSIFVEQGQTHF